jgi:Tol biopolymer transport system component
MSNAIPIRRGRFLLMVMVILTALSGCRGGQQADTADNQQPGKTEKLVFTSLTPDTKQFVIVSMNADGSERTTLSKGAAMEVDPALSPDGKKIAFVSATRDGASSDICVMNADGTGRTTILKGEGSRFAMSPVWSPDGAKITYTVPQDGVVVMDADGKNPKVLGGGMVAGWSPDGTKILYTVIGKGGDTAIHVMNPDGKNPTKLVKGQAMPGAYSPDGKHILYTDAPDGPRSVPCLFVADADGKNPRQLTKPEKGSDVYPRWSADGKRIYFTRLVVQPPPPRSAICVMDADGKKVAELTDGKGMDMLGGQGMTLWMIAPQPKRKPNLGIPPPPKP